MNDFILADELDRAIDRLITHPGSLPEAADVEARDLAGMAGELYLLPDPEFRARLRAALTKRPPVPRVASSRVLARVPFPQSEATPPRHVEVPAEFLPSLFGGGTGGYLLNQRSFAASLAMHVVVLALVISSGVWAARHDELKPFVATRIVFPSDYLVPSGNGEQHGGGSGGNQDKLMASSGSPPRFSDRQVAPPAIVARNPNPSLPVEPTVVGPPEVIFPPDRMGDPFSAATLPSNGPGTGGGIGDRHGSGVGSGDGLGVGPGNRAGIGGDVYQLGGGITAPRPIYEPEPEYSEEARRVKLQGDVVLSVIVGTDGRARNIRTQRSLGMGLDEKAIAAVGQWRFSPATKDGHPVAVQVSIEVNFRLY